MKFLKRAIIILMLFAVMSPAVFFAADAAESYTVSYGKGYFFLNTLTGAEATGIFTGKIPPSVTVEAGGSVTVAENTIVFRDYRFVCWKYEYKVTEDGQEKTVTVTYQPGDVIENIGKDMTLQAVWERPEEIPLKITGFLFYDKNDINVDGQNPEPVRIVSGEEITLADCPFSKDGHVFSGWLDSDGRIYKAGGSYLPSSLNVTLVPVWAKDNEAIVTHKVRYESGTDGAEGELPAAFELYEKTSFIVAANTQTKEGWYFSHWEDGKGNEYRPGDVCVFTGDETVLTSVWYVSSEIFTVTADCSEGGYIAPYGAQEVLRGGELAFEFVPEAGYAVAEVLVNGEAVEAAYGYTFKDVSADGTIYVRFEKQSSQTYSVTLECSEGGTAYLDGAAEIMPGDSRTLTVKPDEGYAVKRVLINGNETAPTADGTYLIENISEDIRAQIDFERESDSEPIYYIIIAAVALLFAAAGILMYKKR